MKIKKRIIVLVFGAGFIASLLFSFIVFLELIEQPFMILDTELKEAAYQSVKFNLNKTNKTTLSYSDLEKDFMKPYWVIIYQQGSKNILYQSPLAEEIKLPMVEPNSGGVASVIKHTGQGMTDNHHRKVTFRIRAFDIRVNEKKLIVQIARSIDKLQEEIQDLVLGVLGGLILSSLVLIVISYFVAGQILKPIGVMNHLASHISVNNLARRVPVGTGKDELNELAGTINQMLDRLQFSFVRQKEYLASASHELQSPLASLRLFFEEASQRYELSGPFQNELKTKLHSVLRMERLVKSLLELSVLEIKDTLTSESFSLTGMVRTLVDDFSPIITKAGIRLELNLPPYLSMEGDKQKIRRMLINVLDNAIKYNTENGEIRIEATKKDSEVNISFFNTGPGVPKDELDRVFDHFYRVEKSRSIEHGGSGLGLAIVREIVRLHKGAVSMESEPGAWARVKIKLVQG